jgi:hypothetical protein
VIFSEYGIGAGTTWFVNLTNGQSFSSQTSTISFFEPNGSYTYSIASSNQKYIALGGSFLVDGSPVSVNVIFLAVGYSVTFNETGLQPAGTEWYVNLSSGKSYSSSTSQITFYIQNGTYSYTIGTDNKDYSSPPGTFTVNGLGITKTVLFSPVQFTVTFKETGLPAGTLWNLTLNGKVTSGTGSISFQELNGTYSYSIGSITGYSTKSYNGQVAVKGSNVVILISWSMLTYPVTITISGLPSGASWSATVEGTTFNGQHNVSTLTSTSNVITFYEPNGSYTFTVSLPTGYHAVGAGGQIKVNGTPASLVLRSTVAFNDIIYVAILVVALLVVFVIIAILLIRRKRDRDLFKKRREMEK